MVLVSAVVNHVRKLVLKSEVYVAEQSCSVNTVTNTKPC